MKLVEMVDSGMPVIITPGRKDMAVNIEEGYDIPSISTVPGKPHLTVADLPSKERSADTRRPVTSDTVAVIAMADSVSDKRSAGAHPADTVVEQASGREKADSTIRREERVVF